MIKVLLADDNKMSLQYFSELICWEKYGYQLVSTAVDGEDAWCAFQKYRPEVVIADIQMPIISGIELAQKVLRIAPDTVFLFLSSYREFQYARAALQLKVYDYLLKHETTEKILIQKLSEIKAYLDQERIKRKLLIKEEVSALFLQEKEERYPWKTTVLFDTETYDCFFVELEHPLSVLERYLSEYLPVRRVPPKDIFIGYCIHHFSEIAALVPVSDNQFLFVTNPQENPFDFCCRIQQDIKGEFSVSCSIAILQKHRTIQECAAFYKNISPLLSQLYFYSASSVIEGAYLMPHPPVMIQNEITQQYLPVHHNILQVMDRHFDAISAAKDYPAFCQIAGIWINILLSYDQHIVDPSSGFIVSLFAGENIPSCCEVNTVYRFIRKKFSKLSDIFALRPIPEFSPLILEAVFIISKHYSNYELTVEWIAKQLKISSSSLNTLFKRETGYTPWKVIVNTRLFHAHQLLELTDRTPGDICFQVGYNSLSYFSKAFKKAYGISPQECKRRQGHELSQI